MAEGLTIEVTWSEALDPASAGSGAGGFVVRIGNADGPAVTGVALDDTDAAKLRLTIAERIADGTSGRHGGIHPAFRERRSATRRATTRSRSRGAMRSR